MCHWMPVTPPSLTVQLSSVHLWSVFVCSVIGGGLVRPQENHFPKHIIWTVFLWILACKEKLHLVLIACSYEVVMFSGVDLYLTSAQVPLQSCSGWGWSMATLSWPDWMSGPPLLPNGGNTDIYVVQLFLQEIYKSMMSSVSLLTNYHH